MLKGESMSGFLIGEHVYLKPFEKEDLIYILKWVNDPEIRGLIGEAKPMTEIDAEKYFEKLQSDKNKVWFVITLKESGKVIGMVGFNKAALSFYEKMSGLRN